MKKTNLFKLLTVTIWIMLMLGATALGIWWMSSFQDPYELAILQERITSLGIIGWFVLLSIQFVQVLLVFVPGGPVQIIAGALFGPLGGLAVILLGIVLASAVIFALVHRFGQRVLRVFVDESDIAKYQHLSTQVKLDFWVVVLFFIPGSPSSALTYIFALTPIKFRRFIALSAAARMPGILISLFMGDSIVQGGFLQAAMLFLTIALLGICGGLFYKKYRR